MIELGVPCRRDTHRCKSYYITPPGRVFSAITCMHSKVINTDLCGVACLINSTAHCLVIATVFNSEWTP